MGSSIRGILTISYMDQLERQALSICPSCMLGLGLGFRILSNKENFQSFCCNFERTGYAYARTFRE